MSMSAMIGKSMYTPVFSRTACTHAMWLWMLSMLSPISLVLREANHSLFWAKPLSSVVQTGVKSAGCEKRMAQLPLMYSLNFSGPWVVIASKSGAGSPMRGIVFIVSMQQINDGCMFSRVMIVTRLRALSTHEPLGEYHTVAPHIDKVRSTAQ